MEDDEEETEIIMSFLIFLIGIIGSWYHNKYLIKELSMNDNDKRAQDRAIWMRSLCHEPTCISQLRLNTKTFSKLCNILYDEGGLVATNNVTIQEIVALFLHILGHDQKNSTIKTIFVRSGETISRQFHTVLRAVLKIGKLLVKQQRDGIYLERDAERWKWFSNAIGALDGTFVDLTVPVEVKSKYRNRKVALSTNVLGVCDANLKFLYVLPGWEGSASDARVLRDALQRPNFLKVCRDKYYLVDAGYTNGPGFLAPYRATRYHLNEWRGNTPTNYKELYNIRHSSARNAIERTFGLLKKRWAILRTASFYDLKTQIRIINACCILHNFVRGEIPKDPLLDEVDRELENREIEDYADKMSLNNKMKSGATTSANKARFMLPDKRAWGGTSSNSDTSAGAHFEALKNKKQSYVSWNKEMDGHLAKVLTDQMVQGNKCDGDTWKPQALQAAVAYLNSTLHLTLTKDNIKNKLKNWKKYFSVVSDIQTRQSGFTWDEERKMIVVTSDEWSAWTTYVESHPDAKGLHNKTIDNWDDIVLLCGKDRATGQGAENFEDGAEAMDEEEENEVNSAPTMQPRLLLFKSLWLARRKKEEKPSGIEIHEVVSKIPGLTSNEIFTVVRKSMNGDVEEYKLLKDLPDEKKRDWVNFLINS
ncbi:hypothetical protein BUALT_Bualt06G0051600 [Buddleja alternifolia]|uniref:Transposase n=1 Tax=Buddleja alternifolia TaxID=168488 RepID=A0AAV6XHD9_9LAMI|nr:hypothetical protein BUALT_Bualt06G0051600 [Buddleja alternifolia]